MGRARARAGTRRYTTSQFALGNARGPRGGAVGAGNDKSRR